MNYRATVITFLTLFNDPMTVPETLVSSRDKAEAIKAAQALVGEEDVILAISLYQSTADAPERVEFWSARDIYGEELGKSNTKVGRNVRRIKRDLGSL